MRNEMPLISVIIPVYNVSKYVTRCVESVQNQTYVNLQILLIDDGSTDESGNICDELAAGDTRIQVIHQENGGLSAARNTGLEAAKGEYVFFVDSDDWIEPETIGGLYEWMLENDAEIGACGVRYAYDIGKEDVELAFTSGNANVWSGRGSIRELILTNNICSVAWNKLYKKSLWGDIRFPEGKLHEDEFTIYKVLFRSKKVCFTPKLWYNYFQRSGSIMAELKSSASLDKLEALLQRYHYFMERKEKELAELTLVEYLEYVKYLYRRNKSRSFRKDLRKRYRQEAGRLKGASYIRIPKKIALIIWSVVPY